MWLFCYQLHTEGVGITVTSRLQENGLLVGLAVVIVFLFQLFQDQIGGGFAALKDQFPTVALPTTQSIQSCTVLCSCVCWSRYW